jgi:hypothetical protein
MYISSPLYEIRIQVQFTMHCERSMSSTAWTTMGLHVNLMITRRRIIVIYKRSSQATWLYSKKAPRSDESQFRYSTMLEPASIIRSKKLLVCLNRSEKATSHISSSLQILKHKHIYYPKERQKIQNRRVVHCWKRNAQIKSWSTNLEGLQGCC